MTRFLSLWNITGKAPEPWTCEVLPTVLSATFYSGGRVLFGCAAPRSRPGKIAGKSSLRSANDACLLNASGGVCRPGNTDGRSGRSCIALERLIKPGCLYVTPSWNELWMMTSPPHFFFPPLRCFSANKQRSIALFWFIYLFFGLISDKRRCLPLPSFSAPSRLPQITHKEWVDPCVFQRRYHGILFSARRLGKH